MECGWCTRAFWSAETSYDRCACAYTFTVYTTYQVHDITAHGARGRVSRGASAPVRGAGGGVAPRHEPRRVRCARLLAPRAMWFDSVNYRLQRYIPLRNESKPKETKRKSTPAQDSRFTTLIIMHQTYSAESCSEYHRLLPLTVLLCAKYTKAESIDPRNL